MVVARLTEWPQVIAEFKLSKCLFCSRLLDCWVTGEILSCFRGHASWLVIAAACSQLLLTALLTVLVVSLHTGEFQARLTVYDGARRLARVPAQGFWHVRSYFSKGWNFVGRASPEWINHSLIKFHIRGDNSFVAAWLLHSEAKQVLKIFERKIWTQLVSHVPTVYFSGCPKTLARYLAIKKYMSWLVKFWSWNSSMSTLEFPKYTGFWGEVKSTAAQGADHEASALQNKDFQVNLEQYCTRRTPTTQMCWSQSTPLP